ncbi:hypothetical protein C2E31_25095 [Rhodopirellula baltica]|nr:hypothetical protein C2E31_25095 [Rhodopirellula baltica]
MVTFDDMGTSGSVRVTIDFQGGTGVDTQAKLNDIVFNLDPSQSISSFAFVEGIAATKNGTQQIFYSAAGVGTGALAGANILFDFPPPGHDPPLQPGSKSVYDIFGSAGLTAASFNVSGGSQPATSPFIAAVHINAVNNGESGHFKATVTTPPGNPPHHTPEPGAMAIFAAFTGLLAVGRKRKA